MKSKKIEPIGWNLYKNDKLVAHTDKPTPDFSEYYGMEKLVQNGLPKKKPINKTNKGRTNELKVRKILEGYGYLVEKKNRSSKWQSPDFWGMFDLVAVLGDVTRWVQVKSHRNDYNKAKRDFKVWLQEHPTWTQPTEVWLHIEGTSNWEIYVFNQRNGIIEEDMMEYPIKKLVEY